MSIDAHSGRAIPAPMVYPFPVPGDKVRLAYRELHKAINGTEDERRGLGNHALLPRPWHRPPAWTQRCDTTCGSGSTTS